MTEPASDLRQLPVLSHTAWQMSFGERTALEGLLAMLKPKLAIEIGRAEGGSLRRIAAHAEHVISFDLIQDAPEAEHLENVTLLVGDSHEQLPDKLAELAAEGRNVDFVLIDGDHSSEGVKADMVDLLESPAVGQTVIIAHDGLNEYVRAGLDAVPYDSYVKVRYVDLDFVPGYVSEVEPFGGDCWGGLAVVIVDVTGAFGPPGGRNTNMVPLPKVVWGWASEFRERSGAAGVSPSIHRRAPDEDPEQLRAELGRTQAEVERMRAELARVHADRGELVREIERQRGILTSIEMSTSWRITEPLRQAKRRLRRR